MNSERRLRKNDGTGEREHRETAHKEEVEHVEAVVYSERVKHPQCPHVGRIVARMPDLDETSPPLTAEPVAETPVFERQGRTWPARVTGILRVIRLRNAAVLVRNLTRPARRMLGRSLRSCGRTLRTQARTLGTALLFVLLIVAGLFWFNAKDAGKDLAQEPEEIAYRSESRTDAAPEEKVAAPGEKAPVVSPPPAPKTEVKPAQAVAAKPEPAPVAKAETQPVVTKPAPVAKAEPAKAPANPAPKVAATPEPKRETKVEPVASPWARKPDSNYFPWGMAVAETAPQPGTPGVAASNGTESPSNPSSAPGALAGTANPVASAGNVPEAGGAPEPVVGFAGYVPPTVERGFDAAPQAGFGNQPSVPYTPNIPAYDVQQVPRPTYPPQAVYQTVPSATVPFTMVPPAAEEYGRNVPYMYPDAVPTFSPGVPVPGNPVASPSGVPQVAMRYEGAAPIPHGYSDAGFANHHASVPPAPPVNPPLPSNPVPYAPPMQAQQVLPPMPGQIPPQSPQQVPSGYPMTYPAGYPVGQDGAPPYGSYSPQVGGDRGAVMPPPSRQRIVAADAAQTFRGFPTEQATQPNGFPAPAYYVQEAPNDRNGMPHGQTAGGTQGGPYHGGIF